MLVGKGRKGPAAQMRLGLRIAMSMPSPSTGHLKAGATPNTARVCRRYSVAEDTYMYIYICAPEVYNYVLKFGCDALEYTM